jgi:GNAT superfamily N-acetyltransferase
VTDDIRIVPANEASWSDIQAIVGDRGPAAICWCQRYKLAPKEAFKSNPPAVRAQRMRDQTRAGETSARTTSGLVAYLDDEPAGWAAVEPRSAYGGLARVYKVPWHGRDEDKSDPSVWAVTCVFVRAGYRKRHVAYALASASVSHARSRGARAIEAYPMLTEPVQEITRGEMNVGNRSIFDAAGFREVGHPTPRRLVMRIDF